MFIFPVLFSKQMQELSQRMPQRHRSLSRLCTHVTMCPSTGRTFRTSSHSGGAWWRLQSRSASLPYYSLKMESTWALGYWQSMYQNKIKEKYICILSSRGRQRNTWNGYFQYWKYLLFTSKFFGPLKYVIGNKRMLKLCMTRPQLCLWLLAITTSRNYVFYRDEK